MQDAAKAGAVMSCYSGDAYLLRVEGELDGLFQYGGGVALGRPPSGYEALTGAVNSLPAIRQSVADASNKYLSQCRRAWTADVRSQIARDLRTRHAKLQEDLGRVAATCRASSGSAHAH